MWLPIELSHAYLIYIFLKNSQTNQYIFFSWGRTRILVYFYSHCSSGALQPYTCPLMLLSSRISLVVTWFWGLFKCLSLLETHIKVFRDEVIWCLGSTWKSLPRKAGGNAWKKNNRNLMIWYKAVFNFYVCLKFFIMKS